MTGYAFLIEDGLDLRVKVYRLLMGTNNEKNDDPNDRDQHKNHLLGKEIHPQLLAAKVTIIHAFADKESCANVRVKSFSSSKSHLLITFAFQKKLL